MDETRRFPGLVFLDSFAALFFVFVATCFYWRGSWDLISAYVLPDSEPLNHWVRFAIGACTSLTYFSLPPIKRALDGRSKAVFLIGSRIFMIVHGSLYMFIWRGLWGLADFYLGKDPLWAWITIAISYTTLVILGVSRQLMWPPYMVPNDDRPDLLIAANRFEIEPERTFLYFLDCFFTSVGINGMAILTWRSAWVFMEAYIYPGEAMKNDLFCVIFGVTGVILFFSIQFPLADISKWFEKNYPHKKLYRIIYEDFVYVFVYLTLILLWRGCWHMNMRYVVTDPALGGPINHCIGLVALLSLRTFSIIAGCGCVRDGGESFGGAFFPIQYLYIYTNPNQFDKDKYVKSNEDGSAKKRISISSITKGHINYGYGSYDVTDKTTVSEDVHNNNVKYSI